MCFDAEVVEKIKVYREQGRIEVVFAPLAAKAEVEAETVADGEEVKQEGGLLPKGYLVRLITFPSQQDGLIISWKSITKKINVLLPSPRRDYKKSTQPKSLLTVSHLFIVISLLPPHRDQQVYTSVSTSTKRTHSVSLDGVDTIRQMNGSMSNSEVDTKAGARSCK
jgi:hypothetical protein